MFKDYSISDYNKILASDKPAPGGGSALAIVASQACSLVTMAANVTLKKFGEQFDYAPQLTSCVKTMTLCQNTLYRFADEDAAAFERILQAMRLPKDTDEQTKQRKAELQKQYHKAALVPLETMQLCTKAISCAQSVLPYLYKYVASDCEIGISLLQTAVKNNLHNVIANTAMIADEDLKRRLESQAHALCGN